MKFDWSTVAKLLLALMASGWVWTQDNQLALLSLIAIVVVWAVKLIAAKTGKEVNKLHLTVILLAISVFCAVAFQGFVFPAWPIFSGDVVVYVGGVITWLGMLVASGGQLFAIATGLYNILLSDVLKQLESPIRARFGIPNEVG